MKVKEALKAILKHSDIDMSDEQVKIIDSMSDEFVLEEKQVGIVDFAISKYPSKLETAKKEARDNSLKEFHSTLEEKIKIDFKGLLSDEEMSRVIGIKGFQKYEMAGQILRKKLDDASNGSKEDKNLKEDYLRLQKEKDDLSVKISNSVDMSEYEKLKAEKEQEVTQTRFALGILSSGKVSTHLLQKPNAERTLIVDWQDYLNGNAKVGDKLVAGIKDGFAVDANGAFIYKDAKEVKRKDLEDPFLKWAGYWKETDIPKPTNNPTPITGGGGNNKQIDDAPMTAYERQKAQKMAENATKRR